MNEIIRLVNTLHFWSDQSAVLPDSFLFKPDGSYFVKLSNGQFEIIKHSFNQMLPYPLTVIALIPVRWQYFISPENLKPEFVGFPSAEARVQDRFHPYRLSGQGPGRENAFLPGKNGNISSRPNIVSFCYWWYLPAYCFCWL